MDPQYVPFDNYRKASLERNIKAHGLDDLVVVCLFAPGPFENPRHEIPPDDVLGDCAKCGRRIHYRPYVPLAASKWCIECAKEASERDPDVLEQLRKDAADATRYLRSRN